MQNAQLVSLSRQVALERQMDVVANNLANINTTGFKAESLMMGAVTMPTAADNDFGGDNTQVSYTEDWASIHDMTNGPLDQTGNPLDVAISGPGFLTVQTPQGTRYTRNGALALDASGTLVDFDGNPIVGDGGPIHFTAADTNIAIAKDGTITSSQGTKGKLAIVEFADAQQLTRDGHNLWNGTGGTPPKTTTIVQGAIEKSNVSGVTEMANMIRVERAYQQMADLMQQQDDLRSTAVQKLGSLAA